ncbi:alcohol acetyltransferase [Mycena rebaudengoi]|nr:alcohol acetyltransferase [Mycena rebaudengoi]
MASPNILRRIGLFERYHSTLHHLALDSCIVASARYTTADGATLTQAVLFPALRAVVEKHAALGVRLAGDLSSSKARFIKLRSIDLSQTVAFSGKADLQTALESHLRRGFDTDSDLPLWRVEVLADNTVVYSMHHVIGDGLSLLVFHTALFNALQNVQSEDASPHVQVPAATALLPPIEALTSLRPSFNTMITELATLFGPASLTAAGSSWTGHNVPKIPNLNGNVLLMKFSALDITAFCGACRTHHTTLTSAFQYIALAVISRLISADPKRRYKTISANVAISLREIANFPADAFGDVVSVHHSYVPVSPTVDWTAAARYSATLKQQKRDARGEVGLLRFLLGNYAAFFKGQLGQKRVAGFVQSNLGRYAPVAAGRWRIENTFFGQNDVARGPAFSMNLVGDPSGGVNATLIWGDHGLDREFAESFIAQFQDTFREIIA